MQRPRNHQGHGVASNNGRLSRGRGGFRPNFNRELPNVPNVSQVTLGAFVSIVLKIDQPTGREVQGIVQDLLTRGDHPRGIKVRLQDGRVGRVQRMCSEEAARAGGSTEEGTPLSGLGRNGEAGRASVGSFTQKYRKSGEEDTRGAPRKGGYSLGNFLPVGHPLRNDAPVVEAESAREAQTCPVCEDFEGDEFAVSHHVATHFD